MQDNKLYREMLKMVREQKELEEAKHIIYAKDEYWNHHRIFTDPRTGKKWVDITTDIARF